MTQLP